MVVEWWQVGAVAVRSGCGEERSGGGEERRR